jgi:hypothetical protein
MIADEAISSQKQKLYKKHFTLYIHALSHVLPIRSDCCAMLHHPDSYIIIKVAWLTMTFVVN